MHELFSRCKKLVTGAVAGTTVLWRHRRRVAVVLTLLLLTSLTAFVAWTRHTVRFIDLGQLHRAPIIYAATTQVFFHPLDHGR